MLTNKRNQLIIFILRILLGWYFVYSGWSKVVTYYIPAPDWTASQFLTNQAGVFSKYFEGMASDKTIDYLNAYGQLAIGLGVMSGTLLRLASFWGIFLMLMYYLAGFPPNNAYLVDIHIIYSAIFVLLMSHGAGRYFGLDKYFEDTYIVKKYPILLKLLG